MGGPESGTGTSISPPREVVYGIELAGVRGLRADVLDTTYKLAAGTAAGAVFSRFLMACKESGVWTVRLMCSSGSFSVLGSLPPPTSRVQRTTLETATSHIHPEDYEKRGRLEVCSCKLEASSPGMNLSTCRSARQSGYEVCTPKPTSKPKTQRCRPVPRGCHNISDDKESRCLGLLDARRIAGRLWADVPYT
ncbi:hypothetical protein FIBSPDRAFT_887155 [Athelia psychrophila]|uniref:Uncharacterized protein n=1 Tax=Athelia psychrophila TaxID=1759441 RepID=A0A166Q1E9_9AGAM|nr:hypothetical protein FIBSPDRAFT_887155 [Fibularhizoctonia sp. CBS 109695]